MTSAQQRDLFLLCAKQLQMAANLAEQAAGDDFGTHTTPYRTAAHLLGIAAYTTELMSSLRQTLEFEA